MARREGIEPVVEGGESAPPDVSAIKAELDAIKAERAADLAKAADAAKAVDEAAAIARGETEGLYKATKAEKEALEAEVKAYRKAEKERLAKVDAANTDRVKALPEAAKALIPEGLTGEALSAHLDKVARFVDTGAGGSEPPRIRVTRTNTAIPEAITAEATGRNMDPADWWALVKKYEPKRAELLTKTLEN